MIAYLENLRTNLSRSWRRPGHAAAEHQAVCPLLLQVCPWYILDDCNRPYCVMLAVGSRPICHTCAATTCGSRVGWEARRLDILSRSSPRSAAPQCVISLGMTEPALSCRTAAPGQLVLWPSQLVGGWQTGRCELDSSTIGQICPRR